MRRAATALLALLALAALLLTRPLSPRGLESRPHPARSYAEALQRVEALRAADHVPLMSGCGTELLTHGGPTRRVVVLLHGLTNCPAQFDSLGRIVFARGANVLIPRLPHHGLADRMTDDLALSDARELAAFTDAVLDAAHGLGDSVTVCGLSIGGAMAAWAAQERADVDRAVIVAPMLGWAGAPGPRRTAALARLGSALPNAFAWWDSRLRERVGGPAHVYPRFATRSVAASLRLGGAAAAFAARSAPAARSLVMVTVGGDRAADNRLAAALMDAWRTHGARELAAYEFPAALHLNHDVVDPAQVGADPARTYPVLLSYIGP